MVTPAGVPVWLFSGLDLLWVTVPNYVGTPAQESSGKEEEHAVPSAESPEEQ